MKLFMDAVEFVAGPCRIRKIYLGSPVTVNAPTHAQFSILTNFIHLSDRTMTGLTLYFTCTHVLSMTEKDMIREVVDLDPFNRFSGLRIFAGIGIIACIAIEFLNFCCSIHFFTILTE